MHPSFKYAVRAVLPGRILIPIAILSLILPLRAGEPGSLTLEKALQMARDNNLTLQQQELLVRQAESDVEIQKTGYLPSLSASGFSTWVFFNQPPVNIPGDNDRRAARCSGG